MPNQKKIKCGMADDIEKYSSRLFSSCSIKFSLSLSSLSIVRTSFWLHTSFLRNKTSLFIEWNSTREEDDYYSQRTFLSVHTNSQIIWDRLWKKSNFCNCSIFGSHWVQHTLLTQGATCKTYKNCPNKYQAYDNIFIISWSM